MNAETSEWIKNLLRFAGVQVLDTRWPFTYHHDWMRGEHGVGSRADVAMLMDRFRQKHGEDAYWAHLIMGAMFYVIKDQPRVLLTVIINHELQRRLKETWEVLEAIPEADRLLTMPIPA